MKKIALFLCSAVLLVSATGAAKKAQAKTASVKARGKNNAQHKSVKIKVKKAAKK